MKKHSSIVPTDKYKNCLKYISQGLQQFPVVSKCHKMSPQAVTRGVTRLYHLGITWAHMVSQGVSRYRKMSQGVRIHTYISIWQCRLCDAAARN